MEKYNAATPGKLSGYFIYFRHLYRRREKNISRVTFRKRIYNTCIAWRWSPTQSLVFLAKLDLKIYMYESTMDITVWLCLLIVTETFYTFSSFYYNSFRQVIVYDILLEMINLYNFLIKKPQFNILNVRRVLNTFQIIVTVSNQYTYSLIMPSSIIWFIFNIYYTQLISLQTSID